MEVRPSEVHGTGPVIVEMSGAGGFTAAIAAVESMLAKKLRRLRVLDVRERDRMVMLTCLALDYRPGRGQEECDR